MIVQTVLHLYFRLTRAMTLGVRAAILTPEGKFVLVRHTYTPGWHFPGGGIERNEVAVEALKREVAQEVGIALTDAPVIFGVYHNRAVSRRDHVLLFTCRLAGALPAKPHSAEIAQIGVFGLDDLPAEINPGTAQRMREILLGEPPRTEW